MEAYFAMGTVFVGTETESRKHIYFVLSAFTSRQMTSYRGAMMFHIYLLQVFIQENMVKARQIAITTVHFICFACLQYLSSPYT